VITDKTQLSFDEVIGLEEPIGIIKEKLVNRDVERAKQKYLSQWQHCQGKRIVAIDHNLVCECGDRFPWERALGEDVELALTMAWLTPVSSSAMV